ncbi:tRNA pseudouridine(13) synthase TruD [Aliikangiella coralliicola]|uniref:tRNA pseudouridine(13) synthase TruD n=1 Tax=Aliikangiella coralliicola TaxID=2592383 RepID=UPI00143D0291|nr:tRNA pseudouridine(13) synthase TruD [Aliikangiella coralliicola]
MSEIPFYQKPSSHELGGHKSNTSDPAEQKKDCLDFSKHLEQLPTANSSPIVSGTIREENADFRVTETLSFEPSGEGEHLFLFIEKTGCNTDWVAKELQRHFNLRSQDIGYAGKKDRYSVSRQWFSLHLPGKEVSLDTVDNEHYRVIKAVRHNKKLRKGVIKHNHFQLKISQLSAGIDENILAKISVEGVPNYFGYQRFGRHGDNLVKAVKLLEKQIKVKSRNKKGLYLSAMRSFFFNQLLAQRVADGNWNYALNGDCLSLDGSQSYFNCEEVDSKLQERLKNGDVHISGLMPGKGRSETTYEARDYEQALINAYPEWFDGVAEAGVSSSRRPLRVIPINLQYAIETNQVMRIEFALPSGSFATSVLREVVNIKDAALERSLAK